MQRPWRTAEAEREGHISLVQTNKSEGEINRQTHTREEYRNILTVLKEPRRESERGRETLTERK